MKFVKSCFLALSLVSMSSLHATPIDVMLLIDGSGSLSAVEFEEQRAFANHFVGQFTFGASEARMGVVEFGTHVNLQVGLSDEASAVTNAIDNMSQSSSNTNHADALIAAHNQFQANGRAGVQQAIVLLTDGLANVSSGANALSDAVSAANMNKDNGVLIYAIGFGSGIDLNDLGFYVSNPVDDFSFHFDSYSSSGVNETLGNIALELQPGPQVGNVAEPLPMLLMLAGLLLFVLTRPVRRASGFGTMVVAE